LLCGIQYIFSREFLHNAGKNNVIVATLVFALPDI